MASASIRLKVKILNKSPLRRINLKMNQKALTLTHLYKDCQLKNKIRSSVISESN